MKNKANEKILEQNWTDIQARVINPLWDYKFKSMYLSAKLDKDDFESLAHEELTKAFDSYNPDDSSVTTYAFNILSKKCLTELRNCTKRDKRKALHVATSLNAPTGKENDMELGEIIAIKETPEIDLLVQRYLDSLTKKQRQVANLMMQGYKDKDIKKLLRMTNEQYGVILISMKKDSKITPLKTLKERMKIK